ncbi:Hsp20/alpha crystallin family protein [Mechercharimyces sp. CAU 1602]|uniref:Hsp20/alpha crystallin family protein n=1 Tax=Mechercharimyces sp. CAU 1602 TaxID=2973933 RepID=UPI002162D858|nr:Hsp20/alpha crystallin family protein [Mechercharimyces sp. CAU 1602]MCS1352049.1 Hsp20/alpha crystallin family protein [Mechercharimyces sp. CAU 1602]
MSLPERAQNRSAELDPFSTFRQEIDRMFKHWFNDGLFERTLSTFNPSIQQTEQDECYCIEMDLTSMSANDVEIEVEENQLAIKMEQIERVESEREGGMRVQQQRYGSFYRTFMLPPDTDPDQIVAKERNGRLYIYIPKKSYSTTRTIGIDRSK